MSNDYRRESSAMTPEVLQELEDFKRKNNVSEYTYRNQFLEKIEQRIKVDKELKKLEKKYKRMVKKSSKDKKYEFPMDDQMNTISDLMAIRKELTRDINGIYLYALDKCKSLCSKRAKKAGFVSNEGYIDYLKNNNHLFDYNPYMEPSYFFDEEEYIKYVQYKMELPEGLKQEKYYDPSYVIDETEKHMKKF